MLRHLIAGDFLGFILLGLALVASICIHEAAHSAAALALGDDTAQRDGRLSLNPKAHLDWFGISGIIFVGLGWGKPVPYSTHRLWGRRQRLFVLAGPAANFLIALAGALVLRALSTAGTTGGTVLWLFLRLLVTLNIMLLVLNLVVPIPPLDGFEIAKWFLLPKRRQAVDFLEEWAFPLLLVLLLFVLPRVLPWLAQPILSRLLP